MAPRIPRRQVDKQPGKDNIPSRTSQRRFRNDVVPEKTDALNNVENVISARPARVKKAPVKFSDYVSPVKNKPNLETSEVPIPTSKSTNPAKGRFRRKALADKTVNSEESDKSKHPIYQPSQLDCNLNKFPCEATDKLAVYDFSFDPDEEPAPLKKKPRKRTLKRREPKPKIVILKDNYSKNLNKALNNLKKIINTGQKNDKQTTSVQSSVKTQHIEVDVNKNNLEKAKGTKTVIINEPLLDNGGQQEPEIEIRPTINYSPIHSHVENLIRPTLASDTLKRPTEFLQQQSPSNDTQAGPHAQINIQNDEDFSFDEQPIASSSFLTSPRRPNATPWRLQWEAPASKWPVNMHVKSNMTPAYESNFSNVDVDTGSRRYPVDIEINTHHDNDTPKDNCKDSNNLVQTSILSFIQEVVTKSAKKKNRSLTPVKHNSNFDNVTDVIFDNASNTQHHDHFLTPEKTHAVVIKPNKVTNISPNKAKVDKVKKKVLQNDESPNKTASHSNNDIPQIQDKENISASPDVTPQKRKQKIMSKTPNKRKKSDKYFGFDLDSDQENQSPTKQAAKPRVLRPRTRGVLREVNSQNKPLRIPESLTKRQAFREEASRLYEQEKVAEQQDPNDKELDPYDIELDVVLDDVDPSVNLTESSETSDVELEKQDQNNDAVADPSPVLFDDVDIVHHNKPVRKSYGQGVKATDRRVSTATSAHSDVELESDEEFGFVQPVIREEKARTKKKKVNKMSKKEEEEAEKWANGFNSMCEDVEGFDLVIE